jgi:hypothetical protein
MSNENVINSFMLEIKEIRFDGVDEFMEKKEFIKEKFKSLNSEVKEIYRWYFYHQLCLLTQKQYLLKYLMWLYTTGEDVLSDLMLQYRLFCEKRNKIDYKCGLESIVNDDNANEIKVTISRYY